MRYSIVFATLAASAMATPYINVEVSEPGDMVEADHNNRAHHGQNRRDHSRNDRRRQGWFSSFFSAGNKEQEERNNRRRHHRNRRMGAEGEEASVSFVGNVYSDWE
jgi:hypothetical protein